MIKKISAEEFNALPLRGRGRTSPTYNSIVNLKPGEGITIGKEGWKTSHTPNTMVRKIEKKYGFKYKKGITADGTAWAIFRIS